MEMGEEGERKEIQYIYTYLSLHCHHHNDSCIKMGSDGSHVNVSFSNCEGQSRVNVSLIVRDKVTIKTVSKNPTLFEEKGEPKQDRAEALLLTSLKPVLNWANVSSRT